jgi:ATP-dependent RNA helicase DDX54/DBP10
VVTDLASRGLDVPSVVLLFIKNWFIQYDFPPKPKIFIHRSGRTARAGLSGKTVSIIATNEVMYILDLLLYIGRKLTNESVSE